jgi:hypothetical protein
MMNEQIREAFECKCVPNFLETKDGLRQDQRGQYLNPVLEDHWQTFQEGWEAAIDHLKNKTNSCYTDIVGDGGLDPRDRYEE